MGEASGYASWPGAYWGSAAGTFVGVHPGGLPAIKTKLRQVVWIALVSSESYV